MMGIGYIYFIESGPYYKIGKTVDLRTRPYQIISSIQRNEPKLPFEPRFVAAIGTLDPNRTEKALHRRFADRRLQGEWFQVERTELIELLQAYESGHESGWIQGLFWKGYAECMDLEVQIPCPS